MRGVSIIELLVAISVAGILLGVGVMNLKDLDSPLLNGAAQLSGFFKQVRAEAISSTSAYFVEPASPGRIITRRGVSCRDENPLLDPRVSLDLPGGATLSDTSWSFCFDSRGLPDANIEIELSDVERKNKIVEVMLGGAVRVR